MGLLVDGKWVDQWYDTGSNDGKFIRSSSQFRNWIKADGSSPFQAESRRYHLYVSLACPWAHRTLIFRQLKGLADHISVSVVDPVMLENGWAFNRNNGHDDPLHQKQFLYEIYQMADPHYHGRVTVPVLWDKQQSTIVSNESAEIIRMFNHEFDHITQNAKDFYPSQQQAKIDEVNDFVYHNINNGVYKAGFATTQEAYQQAFQDLFQALDKMEKRLNQNRYLVGDQITEADWRFFTTLIRFDAVYVGHFKCNKKRIIDYPHLSSYLKDLYCQDGIKETVNLDHIKRHYYMSHKTINPTGVVPVGPDLEWEV